MDTAFSTEMPEAPEFNGEAGEMPEPPAFNGEAGEMPAVPGFNDEIGNAPPDMPNSGDAFPADTATDVDEDENAVSAKGIKASGDIVILGGTFTFDSADDALHADRELILFDGSLTISSGDDALHADASVVISCPALSVGETHTVACGDSLAEITLTDIVTGEGTGGLIFPGSGQFADIAGESDVE